MSIIAGCSEGMDRTWKPPSGRDTYMPPVTNSWITSIIWLYIALNRTPNIDCYWVGAVPNLNPIPQTLSRDQLIGMIRFRV